MDYFKPDSLALQQMVATLKKKRASEFSILRVLKTKGTASSNDEMFNALTQDSPVLIHPLWTIIKNSYVSNASAENLWTFLDDKKIINSEEQWVSHLLDRAPYDSYFQEVCPNGYTVAELSLAEMIHWQAKLEEAFNFISKSENELFQEFKCLLLSIIPIVAKPSHYPSFSFSTRNRIGAIFMTFDSDSRLIADTLVHEFYHNKLNLMLELDPILNNFNSGDNYFSPWRKVPRPMWGILHGCYANYGIIRFWHRFLANLTAHYNVKEKPKIEAGCMKMAVALQIGANSLRRYAKPTLVGALFIDRLVGASDDYFNWACKLDPDMVASYYKKYLSDLEDWKVMYNKPEYVIDSIF